MPRRERTLKRMNAVAKSWLVPGKQLWHSSEARGLAPDSRYVLPSGQAMPLLGLGTWQLRHHTEERIRDAVGAGYRMIDTSGDYHTQRGIGAALRDCGVPRES